MHELSGDVIITMHEKQAMALLNDLRKLPLDYQTNDIAALGMLLCNVESRIDMRNKNMAK